MSKSKLLLGAVVLMVILNIGLLIFIVIGIPSNKGPRQMNKPPRNPLAIVKNKIGFDEDQLALFSKSMNEHKVGIKSMRDDLHTSSVEYYETGLQDTALRDSLIQVINDLNEKVYRVNSKHFDDLRTIGTESQQVEIDQFIKHLLISKQQRKGR